MQFRRVARLKSGTTYPTELEYEKLLKICYGCKRLTHDHTRCPSQIIVKAGTNQEEAEHNQVEYSQEPGLRKKLREKEVKAKESLKHSTSKGVIIRNSQPSVSQRSRREKDR